jgi:hypothetical protein
VLLKQEEEEFEKRKCNKIMAELEEPALNLQKTTEKLFKTHFHSQNSIEHLHLRTVCPYLFRRNQPPKPQQISHVLPPRACSPFKNKSLSAPAIRIATSPVFIAESLSHLFKRVASPIAGHVLQFLEARVRGHYRRALQPFLRRSHIIGANLMRG